MRKLEDSDAAALYACRSNPEVARYQGWCPEGGDEALAFIRQQRRVVPDTPGSWLQLAVCLDDGELIGDLGLEFPSDEPRQAGLGISIAPRHQGKGYATEVVAWALAYLLGDLQKHRVRCSVDPRNLASVALMKRCGFRQEAHHRQSVWCRGEWADDLVFAMLREEWSR